MFRQLVSTAVVTLLLATPSSAQQLDAETQLMLQCGAGYLIAAEHEDLEGTDADRQTLRDMGNFLLTQVDSMLAEGGMSEADRSQLGFDAMAEADRAIENDDASLDADECLELVGSTLNRAEIAAADAEREKRIDMLMTCGGGFYASAQTLRAEGNTADADLLEPLGIAQINAAEELMIEAGLDDAQRFQISQIYGEQIGTQLQNGEDLAYDWDTCAALEY